MKTEFKIGDRVKIYGINRRANVVTVKTTVKEVFLDGLLGFDRKDASLPGSDGFDLTVAHPAQCRKLKVKKKEPKFWYINVYDRPTPFIAHTSKEQADRDAAHSRLECIKVKECK